MEELDNIYKLSVETAKLALLEFDKQLSEEFSPKLDYISLKISKDYYEKISKQLSESTDLIFSIEEPVVNLHSLVRPLVCTQEQSLPKIAFNLTKTSNVQVDYTSFIVDSLSTLHAHFNKHKLNPGNIENYPDGNKQFYVELNKNKVAFSKYGFAQNQETTSLRNRLNTEIESRLRLMADFQNYKKRSDKLLRESSDMASKHLLNQVIEVIDDCNRALQDSNHDGLQLLLDKLKTILKEQGLIEIEIKPGDKFNPEIMEAISSLASSDGQSPNEVLFVEQRGYIYASNNNIYRPAKVIVTK